MSCAAGWKGFQPKPGATDDPLLFLLFFLSVTRTPSMKFKCLRSATSLSISAIWSAYSQAKFQRIAPLSALVVVPDLVLVPVLVPDPIPFPVLIVVCLLFILMDVSLAINVKAKPSNNVRRKANPSISLHSPPCNYILSTACFLNFPLITAKPLWFLWLLFIECDALWLLCADTVVSLHASYVTNYAFLLLSCLFFLSPPCFATCLGCLIFLLQCTGAETKG